MHCAVDIVEKVESFADELVTILEEALLDLALARRVEVVGVRSSGIDVFNDGIHVDDILLGEGLGLLVIEAVL